VSKKSPLSQLDIMLNGEKPPIIAHFSSLSITYFSLLKVDQSLYTHPNVSGHVSFKNLVETESLDFKWPQILVLWDKFITSQHRKSCIQPNLK